MDQCANNLSLILFSSSFFLASSSSCFISSSDFSKFFLGGSRRASISSWNSAIVEYFVADINREVLSSDFFSVLIFLNYLISYRLNNFIYIIIN